MISAVRDTRQQRRRRQRDAGKPPVPQFKVSTPIHRPDFGERRLGRFRWFNGKMQQLHATRGWKPA